jgi:hypothetical protein
MKHFHNVILKSVGAASIAGALAWSGCAQQGVSCATAHGAFAVKLTLKTDTAGVCAESVGGVYGLATYNAVGAEGRPDLDKASMAIQAEEFGIIVGDAEARLGDVVDPDGKLYAQGDFTAAEPAAGVCAVPELVAASKNVPLQPLIPEVPEVVDDPNTPEDESAPAEPAVPAVQATAYKYEWSDLKFLVSEANQGTRFVGTLRLTINKEAIADDPATADVDESVPGSDCVAEYEAVGLYPAVYCMSEDADGNPVADDRLCSATPIAEAGMVTGSGISPDFETVCDPDLFLCVLKDKPTVE